MNKANTKFQIKSNKILYNFGDSEDITHWLDYWYQYECIKFTHPRSILEVGKGSGTLGFMIKQSKYEYKTVDIDKNLKPDYIGNIVNLPLKDNSFDTVCAFQVLEHIPFEEVDQAVSELRRVAKKHVVLSLPYSCFYLSFAFLPFYSRFLDPLFRIVGIRPSAPAYFNITIPTFFLREFHLHITHRWEMGRRGFPISRIRSLFLKKGLKIIKEVSRMLYPYHYFFILEKV